MKKMIDLMLAIMFAFAFSFYGTSVVFAGEHGGKEHGGIKVPKLNEHGDHEHGDKEHGGIEIEPLKEPEPGDIKDTMEDYIKTNSPDGAYRIYDSESRKMRELVLVRIHKRVGRTGDDYYSCADVKDRKTGQLLDIDVDVSNRGGILRVSDVRIHKVEGKARYTYDKNDNRIPLP